MSDFCNGIGCIERKPHQNYPTLAQERLADLLAEEQRSEGLAREGYAPLERNLELLPFTEASTEQGFSTFDPSRFIFTAHPFDAPPVPDPTFAWYQDTEVEVVDPLLTPESLAALVYRANNPTFEDTVDAVLGEARDLIVARQRSYGPSNIEQQGILGVIDRITFDKAARIRKRLNGTIVNGEIVLDDIPLGTVDEPGIVNDAFDFIGYAVCLILLLRDEWGKPLAGESE